MPVMDGLTAIPKLIAACPHVKIIMASTLTVENAAISMAALAAGATDYIGKPTSTTEIASATSFQRELLEKVKALGAAARREEARVSRRIQFASDRTPKSLYPTASIVLRQPPRNVPRVLAIGSSTGGPQALAKLMTGLKSDFGLPIFVTQHMPKTFTGILAGHLGKAAGRPAGEGQDGEIVQPGRIYVAPGDLHMEVVPRGNAVGIRLIKTPPENFCRPSVDPMFRSIAAVYGGNVLACILTGMGRDGCAGGESIVAAGGAIVAQDEASSVVWGMPGAVATTGLCSAVLPLPDIAPYIRKTAGMSV
jgi:two-component system chemotaxis response regulator CheB